MQGLHTLRYNRSSDPMSLITAYHLSKSFGALDVFSNVSFAVPYGARVALVGPNGIGKTTLLRIIIGADDADSGDLHRARNLKIGYLPQEISYSRSRQDEMRLTLWESCLEAFKELCALEEEVGRLESSMADPEQVELALTRYGPMQEAFELAGGYTYPTRIRQVLNGLGFSVEAYDRPLRNLSGGERTRALLARLLLEEPQLLVLDEPTNHLDMEAVEWLEGWLGNWSGAAVIVSHDRYFLDRSVNAVWELFPEGLDTYRGNYSDFLHQRQERRNLQLMAFETQQKFVQKEEDYIRRNIAGQNTRQAQGRRKRLNRMLRDRPIARPETERQIKVNLGKVSRSGDIVLETHTLEIGFSGESEALFQVPDLVLMRGECVGIMGPNGAGKTTFLKTLVEEMLPFKGEVRLGASLEVAYFAQAHEGLDPQRTAIQEIQTIVPDMREAEVRNFLGQFLFQGDDVFKPIRALSGGERGRVALAKIMLAGANLLLLDEPTNHLDIPSQEALQSALEQYEGTILLVSHDRYLIDAMATQVWVISPGERVLEIYLDGYAGYVEMKQKRLQERRETQRKVRPKPHKPVTKVDTADLERVEANISRLEHALMNISQELMEAARDTDRVRELGERYSAVEAALTEQLRIWERLANHIEQA
jgi:ATP-binding cassette subfamily F protein 3